MAIAAVLVTNIFTGFTATAWTWWIFFAVFIGIVVQWVFTVRYNKPLIHNDCLAYMIDTGHLFPYIPWLCSDNTLWQRPLCFPIGLFLALYSYHCVAFAGASLPL